MTTSVTINPAVEYFFIDTSLDSLTLSLATGGANNNNVLRIIMVKGTNTATLPSANTIVNFTSGGGHGSTTTITWNEVGDTISLFWEKRSRKWHILSYYGVGFS